MKFEKTLIKSSTLRASQIVFKQVFILLIFLIGARILTPKDFGLYNLMMVLLSLSTLVADFGISTAVAKFIGESKFDSNQLPREVFKSVIRLFRNFLIISVVVSVILLLFLFPSLKGYALIFIPLSVLMSYSSILDGIHRGFGNYKLLAVTSLASGGISLPLAYWAIHHYGIMGALVVQVIFYLAMCIRLTPKRLHKRSKVELSYLSLKESSIQVGLVGLSYLAFSRFEILVMQLYGLTTEIGYYELINRLVSFSIFPFIIFAQVIGPHLARMYSTRGNFYIRKIYKNSIVVVLSLATLIIAGLYLGIKIVVPHWYENYLFPGFSFLLGIICLTAVIQRCADFYGNGFIIYTGHTKINLSNILIFGSLNILVSVLVLPVYGLAGLVVGKLAITGLGCYVLIRMYYTALATTDIK